MSTLKVLEGTLVRTSVEFRDVTGALADPPTVKVHWKTPLGIITTFTYLIDVELVRDSIGAYHMDQVENEGGQWWVRWEGVALVNEEDFFYVRLGQFP